MFGKKTYHYLVDGLTQANVGVLRRSLATVPEIRTAVVDVGRSTVEVDATRDVADEIRLACEVAGIVYRTRMRL